MDFELGQAQPSGLQDAPNNSPLLPQTLGDIDPFLFQGDEQTWDLDDWNWDPHSLFAAPQDASGGSCCQAQLPALKRRRVPDDSGVHQHILQAQQQAHTLNNLQHQQAHLMSSLAPPSISDGGACGMSLSNVGVQHLPSTHCHTNSNSNCCTFQMPAQASGLQHAAGYIQRPSDTNTNLMPPPNTYNSSTQCAHNPATYATHQNGFGSYTQYSAATPSLPQTLSTFAYPASLQNPYPATSLTAAIQNFQGQTNTRYSSHSCALPPAAVSTDLPPSGHAHAHAPQVQPCSFNPAALLQSLEGMSASAPALVTSSHGCQLAAPAQSQAHAPTTSQAAQLPPLTAAPPTPACTIPSLPPATSELDSKGSLPPPVSFADAKQTAAHKGHTTERRSSHGSHTQTATVKTGKAAATLIAKAAEDQESESGDSESEGEGGHGDLAAADLGNTVVLSDTFDESQRMFCQVPGCGKDLSHLKEYHQRYRICECHIKLPQVLKDGRLQRFCQQCGRFHDLNAFDGARKSCRDQLNKHNARRRRRAQAEAAKVKAAEQATLMSAENPEITGLLTALMKNPGQLHALRLLLGIQTHPALPATQPFLPERLQPATNPADNSGDNAPNINPRAYSLSRDIAQGHGEYAPHFESDHQVLRLSLKLFNRTPADLPVDLKQQVLGWLGHAPAGVEGMIRPGCVFLTMDLLLNKATYKQAVASGVQGLLHHLLTATNCSFWWQGMFMAQVCHSLALVQQGKVLSISNIGSSHSAAKYPVLSAITPICTVAGHSAVLTLTGSHLSEPDTEVVCRWRGRHMKTSVQPIEGGGEIILPALAGPTLLNVEVARGAYLSAAKPVLVVEDEQLAKELCSLQATAAARGLRLSPALVHALLVDVGLVLAHIHGELQPGLSHHDIVEKARRLLALACDLGWASLASHMLPLAAATCGCAAEMVAAIHKSSTHGGLSLLHRAVRSGNVDLVLGMLGWGRSHGYQWQVDSPGPHGITPLHLAALQEDARITMALLDFTGPQAFTQVKTVDGVTPFHLAFQMGNFCIDELVATLSSVTDHQLAPTHDGASEHMDVAYRPKNRCHPLPAEVNHEQKEGSSDVVDPCEQCQCTLPPLLLSIMASCVDCGKRRPCLPLPEGAEQQQACDHGNHSKFSITALCQGCHANRVLVVA